MKIGKALSAFKGTNTKGCYVLLAWHHPASIVWRWCIYWQFSWKLSAGFRIVNNYCYAHLSIPLLGWFSLSTQPKMLR